MGIFHLHFDIETAEGLTVGPDIFCENIEADAPADGADLDGLFRFGVPEFENLDTENRFEEGLGDFLVAEDHCEHKFVGDGELFKGSVLVFHFFLSGAPRKAIGRNGPIPIKRFRGENEPEIFVYVRVFTMGKRKSALSDRSCNAFLDQFLISKNLRLPALSSKCCGILQEIQKS